MTHPLNDEIGQIIWKVANEKSGGFTQEDLMCASADWQLEQVIEWVKHCRGYRLELASETWNFVQDLKEAMRPQEES